jgi:hypothetical protein
MIAEERYSKQLHVQYSAGTGRTRYLTHGSLREEGVDRVVVGEEVLPQEEPSKVVNYEDLEDTENSYGVKCRDVIQLAVACRMLFLRQIGAESRAKTSLGGHKINKDDDNFRMSKFLPENFMQVNAENRSLWEDWIENHGFGDLAREVIQGWVDEEIKEGFLFPREKWSEIRKWDENACVIKIWPDELGKNCRTVFPESENNRLDKIEHRLEGIEKSLGKMVEALVNFKTQLDGIDNDVQDILDQRAQVQTQTPPVPAPLTGTPEAIGLGAPTPSASSSRPPAENLPRTNPKLTPGMEFEGDFGDMMAFGDNH